MSGALVAAGISLVGSMIQAKGQMDAGRSSYDAAFGEASLLEEQGVMTRDDYYRQAALVRDDGERLRAKQTMQYISSGVEAIGTPQLVARETLSRSYARASSYEVTGTNAMNLYYAKANIMRNEGRAALVAGVRQGAGTMLGGIGNFAGAMK
jgi:hypothetical protein